MFDAQQITEWVVVQMATHLQSVHMRLFWASEPEANPAYSLQVWQARQSSPLREEIGLLCRVANGQLLREIASAQQLAEIADTVQGVVEITAGPPLLSQYTIDDAYFATPIGELVAIVMAWQRGDDLISFMDAGRLLVAAGLTSHAPGGVESREIAKALESRVRRMVERGELQRYRNPTPDGATRGAWVLSRVEVERHIAARLAELGEDDG